VLAAEAPESPSSRGLSVTAASPVPCRRAVLDHPAVPADAVKARRLATKLICGTLIAKGSFARFAWSRPQG
jgi:hypothetical protein